MILISLFDGYFSIWKLRVPIRLLIPAIVVLIAKIACSVFLFYTLNIPESGTFWSNPNLVFDWPQNQVLLTGVDGSYDWSLTFVGWDSSWYASIMTKGYMFSPQSFTFSPGLPFIGYAINFVLQNPLLSITLVSLTFGILYIPLFQLLAENFISKKSALISTLLFAFFPYVFVFTTVAYSESLMLFFVIGAWLLTIKGKIAEASVLAVLAPLSRAMGILVIIPMLYNSLKKNNRKASSILLSILPIVSFLSWFFYLSLVTGVPMAPISTTEWSQLWTVRTLLLEGIPQFGIKAIVEAPYQIPPLTTHWLLPPAALVSIVLPILLIAISWKKEKSLWLYSASGFMCILLFGAIVSIPRFISMIFPFWIIFSSELNGDRKTILMLIALIAFFLIVSVNLWQSFLNGQFIS